MSVTIHLEEQLLAHTRGPVRDAIAAVLELGEQDVVVDASHCQEVDASALGLLCRMNKVAKERGARLTIRHPVAQLRRFLQELHLDRILTVEYAP
jgi:anti-anti-sigma regulatory factor